MLTVNEILTKKIGLDIECVDRVYLNGYVKYLQMSGGPDVRLDGNRNNMHHKVFIIDGQTVITGSYNFSRSAEERNDENTLIIHDPVIADQYLVEFDRVFEKAQKP